MRVRAAVVGAGLMGRWHARELERSGGALVAVVDPDREAANRLAESHASATPFASLDEALASSSVDAVHVCSPTETHAPLARQALGSGADVLVEKPLAPDAASTEELIGAASESGRLLCPVHQYLFQPGFELAERASRAAGPWRHLEATACSAGGAGRPERELAGIAAEILPHMLAAIERLTPGGLGATNWSLARSEGGELRAAGDAGGTTISLFVSMTGRPTRNELRLIGAGGTVELDFFHGYGFVEAGRPSRVTKALRPFSLSTRRAGAAAANLTRRTLRWEPAYPGLRALISSFYAASAAGGPPPISHRETLAVATARDDLLALSETAAGHHERQGAQ